MEEKEYNKLINLMDKIAESINDNCEYDGELAVVLDTLVSVLFETIRIDKDLKLRILNKIEERIVK